MDTETTIVIKKQRLEHRNNGYDIKIRVGTQKPRLGYRNNGWDTQKTLRIQK